MFIKKGKRGKTTYPARQRLVQVYFFLPGTVGKRGAATKHSFTRVEAGLMKTRPQE